MPLASNLEHQTDPLATQSPENLLLTLNYLTRLAAADFSQNDYPSDFIEIVLTCIAEIEQLILEKKQP